MDAVGLPQLGLSLVAGGLTTLSPCVFPLLPLVVGGALQGHRLAPLAMGLGMAGSFALIGLALGALGPALGIDSEHVRSAGAWLLIGLAVILLWPAAGERMSRWISPLANVANGASQRLNSQSLVGALLLGGLLGLVWSPCSGPLLGAALTLVAQEGSAGGGALILGLFGIGAATPLVGVAYASRQGVTKWRGLLMAHAGRIKAAFALILLAAGLAILSGGDKWLEAQIVPLLPDAWIDLTTRY